MLIDTITPCTNANSFPNWILYYSLFLLRIGFLYGKIIENAKVKVEVIYEPPQETTDISFQLLSDSGAVEEISLTSLCWCLLLMNVFM